MSLDDERVRFYLRHREQLEEWFSLRADVAAAIDDWLISLDGDVGSLALELGAEMLPAMSEAGYPSLYLKRPTWPGQKAVDAEVLIGLQWPRGKTFLGPTTAPYVGLKAHQATALGRALREDPNLQETRQRRKDSRTQWWPAYGYVPPRHPFPDEADAYRALLISSLRDCWNDYAGAVDRAITRSSNPSTRLESN